MINKEELRMMGFSPLTKFETEWSLDGDRILYNHRQQTLYDADEVNGNDIKLCVVKKAEELKDLVFAYFNVSIN